MRLLVLSLSVLALTACNAEAQEKSAAIVECLEQLNAAIAERDAMPATIRARLRAAGYDAPEPTYDPASGEIPYSEPDFAAALAQWREARIAAENDLEGQAIFAELMADAEALENRVLTYQRRCDDLAREAS